MPRNLKPNLPLSPDLRHRRKGDFQNNVLAEIIRDLTEAENGLCDALHAEQVERQPQTANC